MRAPLRIYRPFTDERAHPPLSSGRYENHPIHHPHCSNRILIYCNNNFDNEPVNFASKLPSVSLNIQSYINLHAYGYTHVYELGPKLDIHTTRIPFVGTDVKNKDD